MHYNGPLKKSLFILIRSWELGGASMLMTFFKCAIFILLKPDNFCSAAFIYNPLRFPISSSSRSLLSGVEDWEVKERLPLALREPKERFQSRGERDALQGAGTKQDPKPVVLTVGVSLAS